MRFIVLAALVMLPLAAFAHKGELDTTGGHVDAKTGKYHCHQEPCFSNHAEKATTPSTATPVKAKRPVTKTEPAPEKSDMKQHDL